MYKEGQFTCFYHRCQLLVIIPFMNTSKHLGHQSFIDAVGPELGRHTSGALTYHPELVAPDGSQGLYYFSLNNLAVYIPNRWLPYLQSDLQFFRASRMHLVFDEDLFSETDFQALNPGEGFGLLRALDPDERPTPRDVVIYETLPNNLPRVAGIISTVPQSPLSHVNLRAIQDGIPNTFIRDALDKPSITTLIDSYVHYTVTEEDWDLRPGHPRGNRCPLRIFPARPYPDAGIQPLGHRDQAPQPDRL